MGIFLVSLMDILLSLCKRHTLGNMTGYNNRVKKNQLILLQCHIISTNLDGAKAEKNTPANMPTFAHAICGLTLARMMRMEKRSITIIKQIWR